MLGTYAIWPCLAIMAGLFCLVGTPLFRAADAVPGRTGDRLVTLDGLRGFLALGVVFHHVAIYHRFLLDGVWTLPPSGFYTMTGQAGVALFFMITGFLFWSRLIAQDGTTCWMRFYVGRLFRIAPVYLVAVALLVLTVFIRNGWLLRVPPEQFATELGRWLALGIVPQVSLNGDPVATLILAGVTWSLRYEWSFYFGLLPAAVFARNSGTHLPFALVLAGTGLAQIAAAGGTAGFWADAEALFGCGMVSASLDRLGIRSTLSDTWRSAIVLVLLCALAACDGAYKALPILLMAWLFHLLAGGCTLYGLLASRPARRLGDISYGIYLLQGPVLLVAFRGLHGLAPGGATGHWIVATLAVVALLVVATIVHATVEQPGIRLGRMVARRVAPSPARHAARIDRAPV